MSGDNQTPVEGQDYNQLVQKVIAELEGVLEVLRA